MDDLFNTDEECLKHPYAVRIYDEIVKSLGEYTNDSVQPKFFLPENLTVNCRSIAAAFVMALSNSSVQLEEIYNSRLYSIFLLASVCGMQIFLKERSIIKNNAPYRITASKTKIKKAQENALQMLTFNFKLSAYTEQVMAKFFLKFIFAKDKEDLVFDNQSLDLEKLDVNLSSAMLWGYYFTKEVVVDGN